MIYSRRDIEGAMGKYPDSHGFSYRMILETDQSLRDEVERLKGILAEMIPDRISFLECCPTGVYEIFCLKNEGDNWGWGICCKYCWENWLKAEVEEKHQDLIPSDKAVQGELW